MWTDNAGYIYIYPAWSVDNADNAGYVYIHLYILYTYMPVLYIHICTYIYLISIYMHVYIYTYM